MLNTFSVYGGNVSDNDDELCDIEDLECESNEAYIRVSINQLTEEQHETITQFVHSVVYDRKVPKLTYAEDGTLVTL